ncbi:MAG: ABC transporter permease [Syntrophobacterales bacterium]|nr:ABC transporter permease [Syntrophobacterales bacterium]
MIKRIWHYRDLLIIFAWREFIIRYRQSVIGIIWAIIQPLSMMLLFTFVFSIILQVDLSPIPYPLFFYAGALPWTFFSSSLYYAIPSLTNHYSLITKIYFPREILPLSYVVVALVDFLIASLCLVILIIFYRISITWNSIWFIPLMAILVIFTFSVTMFLSALNVYYRDVRAATGFLVQLWFFVSPVMYSIDKIDIKLKLVLFLNPLTFIIENMRRCILEGREVVWWQFILVTAIVLLLFLLSYRFFEYVEKSFADVI